MRDMYGCHRAIYNLQCDVSVMYVFLYHGSLQLTFKLLLLKTKNRSMLACLNQHQK